METFREGLAYVLGIGISAAFLISLARRPPAPPRRRVTITTTTEEVTWTTTPLEPLAAPSASAWAPPAFQPRTPIEHAREAASRQDYDALLRSGALTLIGRPTADPGNPGQALALVRDTFGVVAHRGGTLLLAVNGTANDRGLRSLHVVPVPDGMTDPIDAAAWTYPGMTREDYLSLARRT